MRKNKKLLLASVAAMGALALGVGATSTFAWYTASKANISLTNDKQNIAVNDDVSIGEQTVTLHWDITYCNASGVALADQTAPNNEVALTNSDGDTKAWNGSTVVDATTSGNCRMAKLVVSITSADNLNLAGQSYTYKFSGQSNARIHTSAGSVFAQTARNELTGYTLSFDADGHGTFGTDTIYLALSPNNTTGPEYEEFDTSTAGYAAGDKFTHEGKLYEVSAAKSFAQNATFDASKCETPTNNVFSHDLDGVKLTITA